ncbi:7TM diverse intracellular signaling domain-containing protein [Paraglaciecola aestuariivivens]
MQLISTEESVRLTPQLNVFHELTTALSLDEIKHHLGEFTWQPSSNPNYGFSQQGVWLHASVSNITEHNQWVIEVAYAQLEKVDIYLLVDQELVAQSSQGKYNSTPLYRFPTLEVTLPYGQVMDIFIRVENQQSALIAPVNILPGALYAKVNLYDNLMWGLFYGGLIMLALYNFLLFKENQEHSVWLYLGYVCAAVLWLFIWEGHFQLVMPDSVSHWIAKHTDLAFVMMGIFAGLFTLLFLETSLSASISGFYIRIAIASLTVLGILSVLNVLPPIWQSSLVYFFGMFAITTYSYAGYESSKSNFHAARYFTLAWMLFGFCAFVALLAVLAIFPTNFITTYCFHFGVFIQVVLFSVALMDKSRHQLELEVEQTTEDLRNNIELVEEQNVRLDIARKDAIAASNVKSQFLANMSHEIRTPLNAILGFSKELRSDALPPEKQEQVSIINAAADNLLNIVNDVLDFSKIEAGKLKINNHPFSPNDMLEDLVSIMAKSAHLKHLEFIYNVEPLPEKLIGDSYRIKQILNNLLGNALKFTDHGFISLSASGKTLEHGIYEIELKVEDSGIGISRQDQRKLFAAFSQVDDALNRSYQGTGLGLVICQELVKLMRGELSLSSTPNIGSVFTVTIRANLLNTNLSLKPDSEWCDKNVIYFDPNPMSRQCGSKILRHLGANIIGVESLAYLKSIEQHSDIVFVSVPASREIMLPSILEATRHLNADNFVLLYSGLESFSMRSDLSQYFSHKIRMPLTLNKLTNINRTPEDSTSDKLHKRLMSLPTAKVLAVDDMEINLRLLTTWLKNTRLQLTLAYSGHDAVAQCQENEFDLILMDVQMPNMDGLEASKLIRQTELNLGTPIIAVTAHAFKEEQDRLLASGMDDYLPKPINLSDLIDLIKRWCQVTEPVEDNKPAFDWTLALKRANQNQEAAKDILQEFVKQLPSLVDKIVSAGQQNQDQLMQEKVHQLHGACCYTGVPKLHALCNEMETALKNNQAAIAKLRVEKLKTASLDILSEVSQAKIFD